MRRKPIRKTGEDLRDFPTYTIPEAAVILGLPPRTVREWFSGDDAVLSPAGSIGGLPLLSFKDALDVYALFLLRSLHNFSMQSIKSAMEAMSRHTQAKHVVSEHLSVFKDHLLLEMPKRQNRERQLVDLSVHGDQLAIPGIVDVFSNRVLRTGAGEISALFPWRLWKQDQASKPVQINPEIMSGRLVVTGTRIPVSMIHDRVKRGQSLSFIASDYGIPVDRVDKALKHLDQKAA